MVGGLGLRRGISRQASRLRTVTGSSGGSPAVPRWTLFAERLCRAGGARAWSNGARRWQPNAGRPIRQRFIGAVPCQVSATQPLGLSWSGLLRPHTAATAPGGSSPETVQAIGSGQRCGELGLQPSQRASRQPTGCRRWVPG